MEIVKNVKLNNRAESVFDAIVQALFASKNLSVESFGKSRKLLVSLDGSEGGDLKFDYAKYCEGEIGERIVIKQVAQAIFGEYVDPRPLTVPVRKLLESKIVDELEAVDKQLDKSFNSLSKALHKSTPQEKSTISFSPNQSKKKTQPLSFKLGK